MKLRQLILTITIINFISCSVISQENWSLERCITYAYDNNIYLKQQELSVEIAEVDLSQSKAAMYPNLNVSASHAYNYGQTIDLYTNTFATERVQSNNFYISSSITVFNGFQLLNQVRQNQLSLKASRYDLDKLKDDIALQIATAYLNILYNREYLEVARGQQEITKQQVNRTSRMVEAGTLAKGNLLTLEAQLANEELQLVNAHNQLDLAKLTLAQMLDLPDAGKFDIEDPNVSIREGEGLLNTPQQVYALAVQNLPEIKSAELSVDISEKTLAIARGASAPSLSLNGSYGTGYSGASQELTGFSLNGEVDTIGYTLDGSNAWVGTPGYELEYDVIPFWEQIDDNLNQSVGLYLNIPIFNGMATRATINKAKLNMKNAAYNLELAKNDLYKTIQQAHADANAALNEYSATQKSLEAQKESFKYAEQKFNVGLISTTEYNEAKNMLITAESELLQAKYNYIFKKTVLDFYMGKPLKLN